MIEMIDLILVGAGGLGRGVLYQVEDYNAITKTFNILGFVDSGEGIEKNLLNGYKILGDDDWLLGYQKKVGVLICIANPNIRKSVYLKLCQNKNIYFPSFIASNVKHSANLRLGKGCVICLSSIFTTNITLGDFVICDINSTIGHDAVISDFSTIYPGAIIAGNVTIGTETEIGAGSNIIQGKTIGKRVILGAGSVVVKDIPPDCTAVGMPAVPIKYRG
jgi:sugar O-acyltransferase (sialic acid O-acetyltransferase NeuD family)